MREDMQALIKRLAPDLQSELCKRALVLSAVGAAEPIGRRALAARLKLPEREVRAAAAALKDAGLIMLDPSGMTVAETARDMLPDAREMCEAMRGLSDLERALADLLLTRVSIAPGDADTDSRVWRDVARLAGIKLRALLSPGMTLAVTGGRTMHETALCIPTGAPLNVMVVPARGGMGRQVETQASAVAEEIATRLGGHYRVMHLPDQLDDAALREIRRLPEVREIIELLERADVVMHGVGRADDMAARRMLPADTRRALAEGGAVGEAFGVFFDRSGKPVYQTTTICADVGRLKPGRALVAVAAGARKAEAVRAEMRRARHALLVTDEGAARAILALEVHDTHSNSPK